MKKVLLVGRLLCAVSALPLYAGITFGSRQSAIEAGNGSVDFTTTNVALTKGTLRTVGTGSIVADTGEYLNCSKMRIATKASTTTKGMTLDGQLYLDDATLRLTDNNSLVVDGGQVAETVTVTAAAATPAIIQGYGSFAADIDVDGTAAAAGLNMRWQGELSHNVTLTTATNAATLTLEDDLEFARGKGVQATSNTAVGTIDFGGYTMTVGGTADSVFTFGAYNQTWFRPKLRLSGPTAIASTITMTEGDDDDLFISGRGHQLNLNGASFANGNRKAYLTDVHILNYGSNVFAGTGSTTAHNVILDDGTSKIFLADAQFDHTSDSPFLGNFSLSNNARIELLTDLTIHGRWAMTLSSGAPIINGKGNTLHLDDSAAHFRYYGDLDFRNIILKDVLTETFYNQNGDDLLLRNVTWNDGGGAGTVLIDPSPLVADAPHAKVTLGTGADVGLLFGQAVTWTNGARITFLENSTLTSTWTLPASYPSVIDGKGYVFNLSGGTIAFNDDLYLSNITLADVAAGSFNRATGKYLYLSDVAWIDAAAQSAIRIKATTDNAGTISSAKVLLAGTDDGSLFSTAVTWDNGVSIDLLSDVTLSDVWTFSENSVIHGYGHTLDLNGVTGALTIAEGKTLTLRDVVIRNWGALSGSIAFDNNNAVLSMANVTIIMNGNVTLGSTEILSLDGPVYFVTRNYVFDASAADSSNIDIGMTVWYDTINTTGGRPNIRFGDSSGIEVRVKPLSSWSDYVFGDDGVSAAVPHVDQSIHLDYDIDVVAGGAFDALGRQVTFANGNAATVLGNGRTFYFGNAPVSSDTVAFARDLVTVSGSNSNVVEVKDLRFDGWHEQHITDPNALIRYCDGSTIRLREGQTLTTPINCGYNTAGEVVTINLGGNALDMSSDTAAINISDVSATVTICNGRLMNIKDGSSSEIKLSPAGTSSTLVLQDVHLVLSGDTTLKEHNITFKGKCSVTGTGDYELKCEGSQITIAAGAQLRVGKGITLGLYDESATDATLTFASESSTLFIDGGTFDVSGLVSAPTLTRGSLRLDDMATFIGDMTLGSATASLDLSVDLMPAASLYIQSGTITYANAA